MFRKILKTATNSKNRCKTTFSKQFNSRPFSSNPHSFQHEHSSKNSYEQDHTSKIDDGYDFNSFLPVASNEILRKLENEDEKVKSDGPIDISQPVDIDDGQPKILEEPINIVPRTLKSVTEPSTLTLEPPKSPEIKKLAPEIPKISEPVPIAAEFQEPTPPPTKPVFSAIPSYHSEVSEIYNKIKDATCMVRIYSNAKCVSHGSGCFIESEGVAITAAHVVGSQRTVFVSTRNNPEIMLTATVLQLDQLSDIAIIKINKPRGEIDPEPYNFPTIKLAKRNYVVKEGDFCMAVGAPQSQKYYGTVSTGIINCVPRKLGNLSEKIVIQHTAMNGGGLSGGPLLNSEGELMGVHIMGTKTGGTTFGFAARLEDLYYLYDDFKQKTSKYLLGIDYTEHEFVDKNSESGSKQSGSKKYWIVASSQRKELKKGDIILEVEGVSCGEYNSLAGVVKEYIYQGKTIKFKVERVHVEKDKNGKENGKTTKRVEIISVKPMKKPIKI
jgi:S1-C subfamily serine protease